MIFAMAIAPAAEADPGELRLTGKEIADSFYMGDTANSFSLSKVDSKANPYTGKKYTHNSRYDNLKIYNGIDISQFNPVTDYNKVKKAGIDYAFVRMGMRYAVTGNLGLDSKYNTNMKGCIDAGIKVGVYVYSQAITKKEAIEEANHLLSKIGDYQIDMPLIFDYEFYSESGPTKGRLYDANLNKKQMTEICMAFCDTIAAAGYTPMLYGNPSMFLYHLYPEEIAEKYPIWLANYTTKTSYTGTYEFWQYSSTGNINGITGNVDCNFWYSNSLDNYSSSMQVKAIEDQLYTGEAITPNVSVMGKKGATLVKGKDYQLTYENNIDLGTANVTVTGLGDYDGVVKTTTFKIISPKFETASFKSKTKNSITIEWSEVSGAVKYQILRSNARNGSFTQVAAVDSDSLTYTDTNLSSGLEYSYMVRYVDKNSRTVLSPVIVARTSQNGTKQAYTLKKYKIKETPAKKGTKIVTVPVNSYVTYYCNSVNNYGNSWAYVSYTVNDKKYYGYIPQSKVTLYNRAKTKDTKTKIYSAASANASSVATIKKAKKKITILEEVKDSYGNAWSKITVVISSKRYEGYLPSDKIARY